MTLTKASHRYSVSILAAVCFINITILVAVLRPHLFSSPFTPAAGIYHSKNTESVQSALPAQQISTTPAASGVITNNRQPLSLGLAQTECRVTFSGLFDEIDSSVARQVLNITASDIDISWKRDGAARVLIYNNKLYILEARVNDKGHQLPRLLAILHQLNRAILLSPDLLPCIEFSFTINDIPDEHHGNHIVWAFSRHTSLDHNIWLMPDFGYWSWPIEMVGEYAQIEMEMQDTEVGWENKIPKALWRGAVKTNQKLRGALITATRGKSWADVEEVTWKSSTSVSDGSSALPITDHCKYQFLIHTEGRSYSGRGKYLLNCESVVIIQKPQWIEPHTHLYVRSGALQNVVEVEEDFSDLETKMQELLQDSERAKNIAKNSVGTFRDKHLTHAAEACYWRQLFHSWAKVSFTPEPWELGPGGRRKMRGTPFETFVVKSNDECTWFKTLRFQC